MSEDGGSTSGDGGSTSGYDLASLRTAYGSFPVHEETFEKPAEDVEARRRAARRDAFGGARVIVEHGDRALFVRVRDGIPGWDVVGGGREPGEAPEATARREAREEVGLDVALQDVSLVNRLTFVGPDESRSPVTGLWVYFRGEADEPTLEVQTDELHEARWFREPPEPLDRLLEPAL